MEIGEATRVRLSAPDTRLILARDFSDSILWISGGKTPVQPYPPTMTIGERRQRGWRAAVGPLTGWVWQSPNSETTVPTDLLTMLSITANAYAYEAFAHVIGAHLEAVSRTVDAVVARLLARDLLFALEPVDLQWLAEVALGVSVPTPRRRVSTGAVPPPLFFIEGAQVWSLAQRSQVGSRHIHRVEITGDERLAPDGAWRDDGRSSNPRIQLCDLLAQISETQDQSRYQAVIDALLDALDTSTKPKVLRQIAVDLSTLLPLIGEGDYRMLVERSGDDGEDDVPPALLVKTGQWVWYRSQFSAP